jgi:hypothetical protein
MTPVLPGPQLPAHTASRPVRWAAAEAATAAASWVGQVHDEQAVVRACLAGAYVVAEWAS